MRLQDVTFDEYVRLRGAGLVRFARLLVGDRQLGEDLAQEVLARAYLRWDYILDAERPDMYLRRMVVNANISRWRRRSSHEVVGVPEVESVSVGAMETEVAERDELWRLIRALPLKQRTALVARYYEDLDDGAIAEILECSPATVRTHLMRALANLRSRVERGVPQDQRSPR